MEGQSSSCENDVPCLLPKSRGRVGTKKSVLGLASSSSSTKPDYGKHGIGISLPLTVRSSMNRPRKKEDGSRGKDLELIPRCVRW